MVGGETVMRSAKHVIALFVTILIANLLFAYLLPNEGNNIFVEALAVGFLNGIIVFVYERFLKK